MTTSALVVSVVLPVHNGMPYLPATIESLRAQTTQNFEVILVDDGSTDDSPAYLQSLSDDRYRYFRLERSGIASALNFGIERARSELIARIDADDIAYQRRLEVQVAVFDCDPSLVLLGCSFDTIDAAGEITGEWHCLTSDLANRWLMLFTTPFPHPGVMFRRSAALSAGGYDPACPVAQDYDLWARLAEQGTIGNVPQKLIQKRTHAAAWGHQHSTNQRETASRAAARYAERLGLGPDSDDYRRLYAFLWWGEGQSDSEGDAIVEAFQRAIDYFAATGSQDAGEFWKSVAYFQRRLAWRCHEQARIHWTRPLTAAAWLRRARRIDPDHGGLLNTAKRKLCRTLGVPQQEFAAHSYAVC